MLRVANFLALEPNTLFIFCCGQQTLGASISSRNPSWCCTDGIAAVCLVAMVCISYHSQSLIFASKQAEECNLGSKGLQSTLFNLLTYLINLKSKDECSELEQKTLERERRGKRTTGLAALGRLQYFTPTNVNEDSPFCYSFEKWGKG